MPKGLLFMLALRPVRSQLVLETLLAFRPGECFLLSKVRVSSITHVAPVASLGENLLLLLGPRRSIIQISSRRRKGIYTSPAVSI